MPLFLHRLDLHPYRNQIFQEGQHRGDCRLSPAGLHRTSQQVGAGYREKDVRTSRFLPSPMMMMCLRFGQNG